MYSKDFKKGYIFGFIFSLQDSITDVTIDDEQVNKTITMLFLTFNINVTDEDYINAKLLHDEFESYGKKIEDGA